MWTIWFLLLVGFIVLVAAFGRKAVSMFWLLFPLGLIVVAIFQGRVRDIEPGMWILAAMAVFFLGLAYILKQRRNG
jgi:hypothetical protein